MIHAVPSFAGAGTKSDRAPTFPDVNCDDVRTILSAIADAEADRDEAARAQHHLETCAECRSYAAQIARLDRTVRIRPAEPAPDLVARVTARARPAQVGRGGWIRPALAWVALVLLVQSIPALVFGNTDGADAHLSRHLGAFGAALAIGFAYAAWRPHRAFGLLPFTAALVLTMLASAVFDLLDGGRSALAESVHLAELIGLTLLWILAGSPGRHGWHRHDRGHPRLSGPTSA
jgi:predicted anti-sigma-YlaC factor YlaD